MKIVINACFGGFGEISEKAAKRLEELGMKITRYNTEGNYEDPEADIIDMIDNKYSLFSNKRFINHYPRNEKGRKLRTDERFIQVIEELGNEVNSMLTKYKIVEIPDDVDWVIDEYDGFESVEEAHRSWS